MEPAGQYSCRLHAVTSVPPPHVLPAGHRAQAVAAELCPAITPYVLGAHVCAQPIAALVALGTSPYVPTMHSVHCVELVRLGDDDQPPAEQGSCCAGEGQKNPAAHGAEAGEPAGQYSPAEHPTSAAAPAQ